MTLVSKPGQSHAHSRTAKWGPLVRRTFSCLPVTFPSSCMGLRWRSSGGRSDISAGRCEGWVPCETSRIYLLRRRNLRPM
jgi:hypothetical protein